MGKLIYQCTGCGAQFEEGQVKPIFQCSITHRAPYRGSGHFIDCPSCGKFEGVKDLRMPPPIPVPDDNGGPTLNKPKPLQLIDNDSISAGTPSKVLFLHEPQPREKRSCGHEHHPKDGPCGKLSQIPEGPSRRGISTATATVLGMVAALAPEPPPRPSIGGQEQCTSCGRVEGHAPDCRPPRGVRKV